MSRRRLAVSGSLVASHLATPRGHFSDRRPAGGPDGGSGFASSPPADAREVRWDGAAGNICYGLGLLGLDPVLVGAAGADFEPYRLHLKSHGVDTDSVWVSDTRPTARLVRTSDRCRNRSADFHSGAMAEARHIDLGRVLARTGRLTLMAVCSDDLAAMRRHTRACRRLGVPFAVGPCRQLDHLDRDQARQLVDGARWLLTDEHESALLRERTGWTEEAILGRVDCWITTLGGAGARLRRERAPAAEVPAVPVSGVVDRAGAGDAFRAGFLAGTVWGAPPERAAQLGCTLAATVLDYIGTQEYRLYRDSLFARMRDAYGPIALARLLPFLGALT
ncbi:PfkB family carbohydrate kinase [Streptomyces oceani]|uniref:Ribokinase n=1 Tax=Streptomyces oceani TaxID=1075402 RepID=A0A1E7KNV1_9ACTN|nr:PfkB family carbohydrate kinase [Streptomyces oceani]OEV05587.1 ribokinase [Streptomyces oceani]